MSKEQQLYAFRAEFEQSDGVWRINHELLCMFNEFRLTRCARMVIRLKKPLLLKRYL